MSEVSVKDLIEESLKKENNNAYDEVISTVEKQLIETVLIKCYGNISKASILLGINRSTLRSRIDKHTNYAK